MIIIHTLYVYVSVRCHYLEGCVTRFLVVLTEKPTLGAVNEMTSTLAEELTEDFSIIRSCLIAEPCTLNKLVMSAGNDLLINLRTMIKECITALPHENKKPSTHVVGPVWKSIKAIPVLPKTCSAACTKEIFQYLNTIKDATEEMSDFKLEEKAGSSSTGSSADSQLGDDDYFDDLADDIVLNAEEFKLVSGVTNMAKISSFIIKKFVGFLVKLPQDDPSQLVWMEGLTERCGSACALIDDLISSLYPPHDAKHIHTNASSLLAQLKIIVTGLQSSEAFVSYYNRKHDPNSETEAPIVAWFRQVQAALDKCESTFLPSIYHTPESLLSSVAALSVTATSTEDKKQN